MSKLTDFEDDIASVIRKHEIDKFTNMDSHALSKFVVTSLGALKTANFESKESSNVNIFQN